MSTTSNQARSSADVPPPKAGERLDQPEFHRRHEAMPPETRAELVDGVVYMPGPLTWDHGETRADVTCWLASYHRRTPGVRVADGATVILGPYGEPQPDALMRIEPERGGLCRVNEDGYLTGPPELVVEVAHSSRRFDLGPKRLDYERAGVPEYVVVTLAPQGIHWHVRREGRLVRVGPSEDGLYRSEIFPGLWLDPGPLLRGDLDGLIAALDRGLASEEHAAFVARLAERVGK